MSTRKGDINLALEIYNVQQSVLKAVEAAYDLGRAAAFIEGNSLFCTDRANKAERLRWKVQKMAEHAS